MAETPAHTDVLTKGAGSRIQGQTGAMDQPVTVLESRDVIGAEVYGADLSQPLSPAAFATLETALHTRAVLCVRQQRLTAPQFLAFAHPTSSGSTDKPSRRRRPSAWRARHR